MTTPELPSEREKRQTLLRDVEYYGLKEVMVGEKDEAKFLCEQGYAFYNGDLPQPFSLLKDDRTHIFPPHHTTPHYTQCTLLKNRKGSAQGLQESS